MTLLKRAASLNPQLVFTDAVGKSPSESIDTSLFHAFSHNRLHERFHWSSVLEHGIKTARVRGSHPTRIKQVNERVIMSNAPSPLSTTAMCVPWSKAVNPQISRTVDNYVVVVGSYQVGICKFDQI